jgi:hypothetical protein
VPFVSDKKREKFLKDVKNTASNIWKNILNIFYTESVT